MKSIAASVCRRCCSHWLLVLAALVLSSGPLLAQDQPCRSKNGPVHATYPEMAKRMKIEGIVRMSLRVGTDGVARDIKVLGGNPLLVSAAQESVRRARFESSDSCLIVFEFRN